MSTRNSIHSNWSSCWLKSSSYLFQSFNKFSNVWYVLSRFIWLLSSTPVVSIFSTNNSKSCSMVFNFCQICSFVNCKRARFNAFKFIVEHSCNNVVNNDNLESNTSVHWSVDIVKEFFRRLVDFISFNDDCFIGCWSVK